MALHVSHVLQRPSVEVLNRNAFQVNSIEAANIDRAYPIALGIGAFSVRMNATRLAKTVLDNVLVEGVRADVVIRCQHAQLVPRHEPQEGSFTGAHRTIAGHRPIELTFDLERNLAAVAATLVLHAVSP
jgi:hypothetical protein